MVVVHVTHEAVAQVGGIGAVIAGLVTSDAYARRVSRTILLGPLFPDDSPAGGRLGVGGKVIYSSPDSLAPPPWAEKFTPIEQQHEVNIVYGMRPVTDACTRRTVETEVVLVDVSRADHDRLDPFKAALYEKFAVPSERFQDVSDFEQYVRLAGLLAEALVDADDALSARLERGQQLARRMSWGHVVGEYFLPALDRAAHDQLASREVGIYAGCHDVLPMTRQR